MPDPIAISRVDQGMITLRGDLADPAFGKAVQSVVGTTVPRQREIVHSGAGAAAWMSADELLLLVRRADAQTLSAKLDLALAKHHHLAVNVSDARALFRIAGKGVREVLAKGAPVDLAPGRFEPGMIRRSRIGLLAAAFWMPAADTFDIICFRSLAQHLEAWLRHSARPGSLPGVFRGVSVPANDMVLDGPAARTKAGHNSKKQGEKP